MHWTISPSAQFDRAALAEQADAFGGPGWEVQLDAADLERTRFFPRAQWRKVSRGEFYVNEIVERIRSNGNRKLGSAFVNKLHTVGQELQQNRSSAGSVLLIAKDETSPLTIIEGNHRVAAALLMSPELLQRRFRILCGLSPRMTDCCWYQGSITNLLRYGRNKLRHIASDRNKDLDRWLAIETVAPVVST